METALVVGITAYLTLMLVIGFFAEKKVQSEEDYIVAGRRLPLALSSATLLATWFGAGTLLTASDEIRSTGLTSTALEPYGAGLCLLIAGFFFAAPLWKEKICTLSDLYRKKFGRKTEVASAAIMIPGYIGWVAVQLVALAGICQLLFGLPTSYGIVIVGGVSIVYTLLGGMWAVTLTDAIQICLIIIGLLALSFMTFFSFGDGDLFGGFFRAWNSTDPQKLYFIPRQSIGEFVSWLGVLALTSLGNIPGQDLTQRIFAAKSASTAKKACFLSGIVYVALGTLPAVLGVLSPILLDTPAEQSVLMALAIQYLNPVVAFIFIFAVISAVFSTIDSAMLSPATTLSRNILRLHISNKISSLALCRISVLLIGALSITVAFVGENAYSILEASYAIGFVSLFVPICVALFFKVKNEKAILLSMLVGIGVWSIEWFVETQIPISLIACLAGFGAYFLFSRIFLETTQKQSLSA